MTDKTKARRDALIEEYRAVSRRLVFLEGSIASLNDLIRELEAENPATEPAKESENNG